MRTFAELAHPDCKVSLIAFGQKYIVKCEQGAVEQQFKFEKIDFESEADFRAKIDANFIAAVANSFQRMQELRAGLLT